MTTDHEASRTLVKSPPELWAECSDPGSLARHIGEFGEIRITRLEPETSVAWEGDHASGTVDIEPSGWGTRVTLRAQTRPGEIAEGPPPPDVADGPLDLTPDPPSSENESPQEEADAQLEETLEEPDPHPVADADRPRRRWRRMIARTRGRWRRRQLSKPDAEPDDSPEPQESDAPEPDGAVMSEPAATAVLEPEPAPMEPPEPEAEPSLDADAILAAALDSLGQAHHRPFSRA